MLSLGYLLGILIDVQSVECGQFNRSIVLIREDFCLHMDIVTVMHIYTNYTEYSNYLYSKIIILKTF